MAYVISVCGAGGKSTKCEELANAYKKQNKKVCIITTTHMWNNDLLNNFEEINNAKCGEIYRFGTIDGEKITYVGDDNYYKICNSFDVVIIEADGSKGMPLKIPDYNKEPIIKSNTNKIIVLAGTQSIGRKLGVVCHRFEENADKDRFLSDNNLKYDTIVTVDIIDKIVNHYYIDFLKNKYKNIDVLYEKIDMSNNDNYKNINNLVLSLCASGLSKRFGKNNKLLAKINNRSLYSIMFDKLLNVRNMLLDKFNKELNYNNLNIDVVCVSKYDEILEDDLYKNKIKMIKNNNAEFGLSSSIKLTIENNKNADAIMFINSDIPLISEKEITYFLYNSICNNSGISSMFTDFAKNPAYFEKKYFDEILNIDGDKGPKELFVKYKKELFKYYIDKDELFDIDTEDDLMEVTKLL